MCSGNRLTARNERTRGLGHMNAIEPRIISAIQIRLKSIREWIAEDAPYSTADQRHLDINTPERAYWHLGYETALSDILKLAEQFSSPKYHNGDKSS
jgi:hypothetical protein